MPKIDHEKFYTSAIEKYGTSAKGVNWASSASQKLRFKTILELLPKELNSYTLLDAGCGFGDFYLYLEKKGNLPKNYIGVDSLESMYSIASNATGCEILIADITKDVLPNADIVICSGALNTLELFETHLFIQNCYASANIAFIFNILFGDKDSETYNYISSQEINQIIKDLKVPKVEYKTEYMENDITVAFYKEQKLK